jgi:hypothetical protein
VTLATYKLAWRSSRTSFQTPHAGEAIPPPWGRAKALRLIARVVKRRESFILTRKGG